VAPAMAGKGLVIRGAAWVECHHEELAVGRRCQMYGLGWLYAGPLGVEKRIEGNALLSAIRTSQSITTSIIGIE